MGKFLFCSPPRPSALGQPILYQKGTGDSFRGNKAAGGGGEADLSPLSNAEVKNACSYTSTPAVRLHGVALSLVWDTSS
jgi:hypothetical protein